MMQTAIFFRISATALLVTLATACAREDVQEKNVRRLDASQASEQARSIESMVKPQLAEGLTLKLWAGDSLVADPVSIDVDDDGSLYYTRTNRQKNSEFDIRGHQDWEIESIALQSIDDKRAFLRRILSPENSEKNKWLADLNKDGSHDWRDMTIQKEHVYRLQDENGDGIADVSRLVIEDFNEEVTDAAGGVLKYNGDLFVGIGPDLWRVKDNNNDGVADGKVSISHGYGIHIGFSGHGMSGIEVGPEGKIYWQIGDIGFNGVGPDGKKWEHPNSGVIVRANPDGSDFEVFAYGNRNTHEFVFDEYGNLISEDNDGDHPGESERIVYIVNGADIGWRINWQFGKYNDPDNNRYKVWMDEKLYVPRFEGQAAYITPCIANYVNGPTGMLYNPGTALGEKWKNTFFIGEFVGNPAQSGIHAFKLKPKGATFELGENQQVLGGVLATGIDFGADGAMYIADWIDGWDTKDHGRVWKLDVADPDQAQRDETKKYLTDDLTSYSIEALGALLRHPDMRVRQKGQFALVMQGDKGLEELKRVLTQTDRQLARVHAIWGISQFARKDLKHAALLVPLLKDADPEIRAQAAKWIGDVRYGEAGNALITLLTDDYSRARFFAAEALGRTAAKQATQPLISLLEKNNDEDAYIRHAASLALARIGDADALARLTGHASAAVRMGAVIALRRMQHAGVGGFVNDADEFVATEAARAINDDLSITAALPSLGDALATTSFKNEALLRRAINANLRTGTDRGMQNLLQFARSDDKPPAMRAEALAALSTWAAPSVVDRVDGRYRGAIKRDVTAVRDAATPVLLTLIVNKDATVRLAVVKASGKLGIDAGAQLFVRLKSDPDARVREAALQALVAIDYKEISQAIQTALSDKEKSVRVTALDLLPKMDMPTDLMARLLSQVISTRTIEERQAALVTLGGLPLNDAQPVFEKLLDQFKTGKLPAEIQLELAEGIASTKSATLKNRYTEISRGLGPDTLVTAYAGALMGGNPDRGARIFYGHQTAQCIRCHAYGDYGGNAGPRLNGVASRLSREQLLEALINPSARLAPGYGMVSLELTNGKKLSAILQEETATTLTAKIGNKPDTVISKTDVVKRTDAASSMPPMRTLLTKKEIRDVVSFLAVMKEE